MKLSVIIACYNAADTIGDQLNALASQHWSEPWEVIVVDNLSTDDLMEVVARYKARLPNLQIVKAYDRHSRAYARNVGVRAARSEAIAFVDADDQVAPGWASAMGNALETFNFVAGRFETKTLNPPWLSEALENRVCSHQRDDLAQNWYPPYLPHAAGGTLGIRRSLHEAIGGFDESQVFLSDTDYCFRAQLLGHKLHFVPDAVVHYRYRTTLRGIYVQARNWAQYDTLLFKKYGYKGSRELWRWRAYLKVWAAVVKRVPGSLLSREGRAVSMWRMGRLVGALKGSLLYRVPPTEIETW
jgi:glycosyltransferase involved in cell wall biosynthesis